jgi:hypothetical protein
MLYLEHNLREREKELAFPKIGIIFLSLLLLFNLSYPQIAGASIFAPGTTLNPDCPPTESLLTCGVSVPAATNIGSTNLTLSGTRTLTLDGHTLTFDGTTGDMIFGDNGNLSIGGGLTIIGGNITTTGSGLTLSANALSTGTIQIGGGGAGSTTPDILTLDIKSDAGDPAGTNGSMYYNANTNKLRCFENGGWGDCIFQSTGSAQNLTLARIGSSTFSTLQDLQNVFHSAGWVSGGAITTGVGETINIAAGSGLIRNSNTSTATVSYFDWAADNAVSIPTDSTRYIGVEYNGGSPQVSVRTSPNWNLKTDFSIGVAVNENGQVFITSDLQAVGDHAANMIQREYETMPLKRDDRDGGLILTETGIRNIKLSAGAIWDRLNRYPIAALDTSLVGGKFEAYYRNGGGFTKVSNLTQWPNTQYDNGSGLVSITPGDYAVLWFYVNTNGKVMMVYGRNQYINASLADNEIEPDTLPDRITVSGTLIGKIIFQESAGVGISVASVFSTTFSSLSDDHANLSDLDFLNSGHTGFADAIAGVNDNITSMTAISSIAPSAGLTITGAGASTWSTSAGDLTLDSAAVLNLGTTNATALSVGKSGVTTTNKGNLSIVGNLSTPKSTDHATTGTQNNVTLDTGGIGSLFRYTGISNATFTGIIGGTDGRIIHIMNASSASNLILTNEGAGSLAANRILTANGGTATVGPNGTVSLQYDSGADSGVGRWRVTALPVEETSLSQGGNAFGATLTFGTTDANVINFITGGSTRFSLADGAPGSAILTGTGTTTFTANAGSALNVTSGTGVGGILTLDSGDTGAVNIGNNANAKTITIGNITLGTAVNLNTGTGGTTYTTTNGIFTLNTGTGAINLGTDTVAKTITVGNVIGASALNLSAGSGGGSFISSSGLTLNPFGVSAGNTTEARFAELAANGANYVGFKAPDLLGGNVIWTLPDSDGTVGQVLSTDGFKNLSWASAGACVTCVVNTSKFSVDETSGNILKINNVATSFPASQGGSGDVLTNDGAGNLTWSPSGAGSTALSGVTAATGNATIGNGNNNINWNWSLSGATNGFNISENVASTGTGYLERIATIAASTAKPFSLGARGTTIFNTTATGGITLGDSATLNTPIALQSGTGAIDIGADTVAHTITIGSTTGATAVNINSGSGGINFGANTVVSGSNTFATGTGTTTVNSTLVTLAGNSTVINMTGTGTLGLNTTTNRAITTGTGIFTTGGDMTVSGNTIETGNLTTPAGTNFTITGTTNNLTFASAGSLFRYTGAGTATFTGFTGGVEGKIFRVINASAFNLIIANQNAGSTDVNRIITASGADATVAPDVSVTLQFDSTAASGVGRWRIVTLPATALSGTVFLQGGNGFGTTASLGTTDANPLNLITSGSTRFTVSSAGATLTGTGATALTSSAATSIDATTGLSLGTGTATSVAIGATGVTTTNNGSLTSTQTLTASNGLTLTTGALNLTATSGTLTLGSTTLAGASPLVFDGTTVDAIKTIFAITNPTVTSKTITFPNASLTVNAAIDISGTTLASNVVTSSLTAVGPLSSGSIASGFGSIATTNDITTSANISSTGTGTTTSAGTLTASNGLTQTTGALNLTATSGTLTLSGLSASSASFGANDVNFTSGHFNTTATGINTTAIGATTASTGKFTNLTSTSATDLANAGASNVTIATTGTGNVTVGNSTGTFALTSNGGLNVTTVGALTGVASLDTISISATALTFAGAGTITGTTTLVLNSTGANAVTLDSTTTGNVNVGNGANAKTITIGNNTTTTALNLTSGTGSQTFTSSVATGTTTTSAFVFTDTALSSGTGLYAASSTLSSGKLMDLQISGTAATASQTGLNILTAGATSTNAITTYGSQISNTHTNGTSGTNIALYLNASGATTANYGLIVNAGNVGIGLTTPSRTLDVTGDWGGNVVTTSTTDSGTTSTIATKALAYYVQSSDTTGSCATGSKTFNITGLSDTEGSYAYIVTKATDAGCGSSTLTLTLSINGTTISTVANANTGGTVTENYVVAFVNAAWRILGTPSTADGADLAETYSTNDESIEAGDVVSFDSMLKFGVKKSAGINDKGVIGIVSTMPGMVMGGISEEGVTALPVALLGRVPVKVNTENGPISAGDYLTSSSVPGVATKSNGTGIVLGQAMSPYNGTGQGIVLAFIKNFDLGSVEQLSVLMGDISPKANADGTDNGLSTLLSTIQFETAHDPIAIIAAKITDGKQFLTDFISARVTAIRGYFDEVFAKKVHTDQICIKKSDSTEVCVNGNQLDALLKNADIVPTPSVTTPDSTPTPTSAPTPDPVPTPTSDQTPVPSTTPDATPTPTPVPDPASTSDVTSEPVPDTAPVLAPDPTPEVTSAPETAPSPDPTPTPAPALAQ